METIEKLVFFNKMDHDMDNFKKRKKYNYHRLKILFFKSK